MKVMVRGAAYVIVSITIPLALLFLLLQQSAAAGVCLAVTAAAAGGDLLARRRSALPATAPPSRGARIAVAVHLAIIGGLAVAAFLTMVSIAWSQAACYRPVQPYPFAPPADDPEFYAYVNGEYQRYMLEMETYLNCLNVEQASAFQEVEVVMDRWIEHFGDDAALWFDLEED